jgi:hypothetical protein
MVFPKLLGGVLAGDSLEDLGSAWVLVYEACGVMSARSCVARTNQLAYKGLGQNDREEKIGG